MILRRTVLLVEDESHCISTLEIAFDSDTEPRLAHTSTAEEALLILTRPKSRRSSPTFTSRRWTASN